MLTDEKEHTNEESGNTEDPVGEGKQTKQRGIYKYIGKGGIAGIVIGGIAGYLYYHYIGCRSGSCPINSNPYFSIAWGAVIGYLLGDMFRKKPSKKGQTS